MKNSWKEATVEDIKDSSAYSIAMGPFGSNIKTDNFVPSGVPIIRGVNLNADRFLDDKFVFLTEEKADELKSANAFQGDLVFTHRGTLGQVGIIPLNAKYKRYVVSQSQMKLRCNQEKADPNFIFYFFKSPQGQNVLLANTSTTGVPAISSPLTSLRRIKILLPPVSEQRAIAGILGALDDKIELNRHMNTTLESMARAVFREMMKNEDGKWNTGSILEFANLLSGGTPRTSEASYWNGNIEWASAKDVGNVDGIFLLDTEKKITQLGVDNSSTKLLPEKTTIVTARGTVGRYCMLGKSMTMNQTNYGLKAKAGIGDYFIYFTLSEMVEQLKQQSYGTIFDTITTKIFQNAQCIQPPLDIIHGFDLRVKPLMDAILNNQEESRTLASLRDSLLPKLMRGEIRVKV